MKVAIHVDSGYMHSTNWAGSWVQFCEDNDIDYATVDCYSVAFRENIGLYNIVLWHFSHYSSRDMIFARSILRAISARGVGVFPGGNDSWHFDDKVAQDYFLSFLGVSIPRSYVFFDRSSFEKMPSERLRFPLVAKLKGGSGSHNVQLIRDGGELDSYVGAMFGKGVSSKPKVFYKVISNVLSVRGFSDIWTRFKRIPDFISTLLKSSSLRPDSGYVYLQEFIDNNGFDLKVVVVGRKLSFIARRTRVGDFRASGGGGIFFDKALVSDKVIDLCFSASDKTSSFCMGYDVVIDKETGDPYILEMSYGFSHQALLSSGGYWDRDSIWHDEPLDAPKDIISHLLKSV